MHEINGGQESFTNGDYLVSMPGMCDQAVQHRTTLISLARLDPWFKRDPIKDCHTYESKDERYALLLRRSCLWIAQHIMLFFGMGHCTYYSCCLNGFINLEECIYTPIQACPICLRKLLDAIGVHTISRCIARYNAVRAFCRINIGVFDREFRWYTKRVKMLDARFEKHLTDEQIRRMFPKQRARKHTRSKLLPPLSP